jgi:hypothetical protein
VGKVKRQAKKFGKRIWLWSGAWLKDDGRCVVRVHRTVDVVGEWDADGYLIPVGGRVLRANDYDVKDVDDIPRLRRFTQDEADEHNTILMTCRYCGGWLEDGDDGFGTEHGWCGCEDDAG